MSSFSATTGKIKNNRKNVKNIKKQENILSTVHLKEYRGIKDSFYHQVSELLIAYLAKKSPPAKTGFVSGQNNDESNHLKARKSITKKYPNIKELNFDRTK